MFTLTSPCSSHESTRIRSCHCCYRSECRRSCCSLPIEEILGWILICSLIFWLYNVIKLCLTIALISFVTYWIYQHVPLGRWMEELAEKINKLDQSVIEVIQAIVQRLVAKQKKIAPDPINEETTVERTKETSSPAVTNQPKNEEVPLQKREDDDHLERTMTKSESKQPIKVASRTKNRFTVSPSTTDENHRPHSLLDHASSISQPGYHGPIHTLKSETEEVPWFRRQPQSSMDLITGLIQTRRAISSTSRMSSEMPNVEDPTVADILEQTKGIRQAIAHLHEDVLQIRADQEAHLSNEEKEVLKLAATHLLQTINTSKIDDKMTVPSNHRSHVSASEQQQSQSVHAATSLTDLTSPKCLPVQPSVLVNSTIPRVPSKATVIAINNDDDHEIAYDDDTSTNDHIVIIADQFENIPSRTAGQFQDHTLAKESPAYRNDRINWIDYVPKRDPFPNAIQSDLPILHIDDQSSSFKQSLLSHFHRRPKLVNNHSVAQPPPLIRAKSLQQLQMKNQRVFRVRKSRILVSFDDLQRAIEVVHPSEPRINTIKQDNPVNNNQNERNRSIMSLVQAFDSAIRQGELTIENEENRTVRISSCDSTTDEYLLSIDSQSLFSVVSDCM